MNNKRVCTLIVQILICISGFSQIDSTSNTTIEEIVIYEYDTVFVTPDTIRIVDTIKISETNAETIKEKEIKKKKYTRRHLPYMKMPAFLTPIAPNSTGLSISTYLAGNLNGEKITDTLSTLLVYNMSYSILFNYNIKPYIFSIGFGFNPYHEKHEYIHTYYSTNKKENQLSSYDSLLISEKKIFNYYFNYLNLSLLLGRKFNFNNQFNLVISLGCTGDYLVSYKQGNTNISENQTRKYDLSYTIHTRLAYRFSKDFEFFLIPFFQYSVFDNKKAPYSSYQKMGIAIGLNIFSKGK